ncbi:hypothetical protein ACOSQ3_010673 [Xanthoceras sorbifolium]
MDSVYGLFSNNVALPTTVEEYDSDEDDSYEVDEEIGENNKMAKYCIRHQWTPNSNGSIELKEGQVLGNAKLIRAAKIKNDSCRYTVSRKNDACDWMLHASSLPDGVTYMIKSMRGSHSFCRRVVENKEANARWSNPTIEVKTLRNELQDRFGVRCDRQTLYRAKKIVLKTMKADHVDSYAKLKKHMPANFKCAFKNHNLNGKLWHIARVGSAIDFKEALKWVGEDYVDVVN